MVVLKHDKSQNVQLLLRSVASSSSSLLLHNIYEELLLPHKKATFSQTVPKIHLAIDTTLRFVLYLNAKAL